MNRFKETLEYLKEIVDPVASYTLSAHVWITIMEALEIASKNETHGIRVRTDLEKYYNQSFTD